MDGWVRKMMICLNGCKLLGEHGSSWITSYGLCEGNKKKKQGNFRRLGSFCHLASGR